MFFTEDGTIGNARESIEVGDNVALFAGLDVPVVIRRGGDDTGDYFSLISPTYFDGAMLGDLWHDVPERRRDFKLF
jgi:hypothetical protein